MKAKNPSFRTYITWTITPLRDDESSKGCNRKKKASSIKIANTKASMTSQVMTRAYEIPAIHSHVSIAGSED